MNKKEQEKASKCKMLFLKASFAMLNIAAGGDMNEKKFIENGQLFINACYQEAVQSNNNNTIRAIGPLIYEYDKREDYINKGKALILKCL